MSAVLEAQPGVALAEFRDLQDALMFCRWKSQGGDAVYTVTGGVNFQFAVRPMHIVPIAHERPLRLV